MTSTAMISPLEAGTQSRSPRSCVGRITATLLLGLLAIQVGWLLAVPNFRGLDEIDHVFRASSVASGHWQASHQSPEDGRGFLIPVPTDIVDAAAQSCGELTYVGTDNCSPTSEPDDQGRVLVASAAATYNPAWYFVVGTAARPFEGSTANLAMRLCSLLLCDLVVGFALWLLARRTSSQWATIGIALACLPVLVYSTSVAAPNGLGYCAGLLLWVSLLTLPRGPAESLRGPAAGVAISAPLMMVTHSTGLVWVTMSLICAAPLVAPRVRQLWTRSRLPITGVALVCLVTAALTVAWVFSAGTNDPRAEDDFDYGPAPAKTLLQGLLLWPLQAIATLQMRNNAAPIAVYAIAVALLSIFVLAAWRIARRAERFSIAAVALASLAIPFAATVATYRELTAAWQGRYGLALAVGIIVVAATVLARTHAPRPVTCWASAAALAAMHWFTLAAMFRVDLSGAAEPWTPWFVGAGALITTGAFGRAFSRPVSLRE